MSLAITTFVVTAILTTLFYVLAIDMHHSGYLKGYDEGMEDAINTFQRLIEEEEAEGLECSKR